MLGHTTGPESTEPRTLEKSFLLEAVPSNTQSGLHRSNDPTFCCSLPEMLNRSTHTGDLCLAALELVGFTTKVKVPCFLEGDLPLVRDSTLCVGASAVEECYVPVWQRVQTAKEWAPSSSLCVKTSSLPHAGQSPVTQWTLRGHTSQYCCKYQLADWRGQGQSTPSSCPSVHCLPQTSVLPLSRLNQSDDKRLSHT